MFKIVERFMARIKSRFPRREGFIVYSFIE